MSGLWCPIIKEECKDRCVLQDGNGCMISQFLDIKIGIYTEAMIKDNAMRNVNNPDRLNLDDVLNEKKS